MSPEKGLLEQYEEIKRDKGNTAAAEIARVLREQYGDELLPLQEEGVKLTSEPEILYTRKRDVVSRFVKEAIKEAAHLIKPRVQALSPERWIRGRNILGSFLLSSATQKDIGRIYGISSVNATLAINRSIKYLWLSASPELQQQFILPHEAVGKHGVTVPKLARSSQKLRPFRPHKPVALPPEGKPIHPKLREALSGIQFSFIDPESREFLKQAFTLKQTFTEEGHIIVPPGMNAERWLTYRNIFGTFILSHATLGQVGKIYGISRERVRQINEEVLEKLFPNTDISLDKLVKYLPDEWLLVKDSMGSEIVEMLEQELPPDQITSRFEKGYPRMQAIKALKMLREMGFNTKRIKASHGEYLRIQQELLKDDLSDEETRVLLDQINGRRGIEVLHASGVIISVRNIFNSAGFHFRLDEQHYFHEALIDAGIPLGILKINIPSGPQKGIKYSLFIATRHRQRAEQALKNDPNLAKFLDNPVKQVSGPKAKIPNTNQIAKKDGVISFASIASEFGIGSIGKKIKELQTSLESSNQIPLFLYTTSGTLYVLKSDSQNLRSFIKAELESKNS